MTKRKRKKVYLACYLHQDICGFDFCLLSPVRLSRTVCSDFASALKGYKCSGIRVSFKEYLLLSFGLGQGCSLFKE